MSAVLPLNHHMPAIVATSQPTEWDRLRDDQRASATLRLMLVRHVLAIMGNGASRRRAVDLVLARIAGGHAPDEVATAAAQLARGGDMPSAATLDRWCVAYGKRGVAGLAPDYKGRKRADYGWEARALHFYSLPSKPDMATVAKWLRDEGQDSATDSRVRRYIKSLPADAAERGRLGARLFANTCKSYRRRNTEDLPVGYVYQGDGHTVDVYVAHPETGRIWRPELTVWMDVASRYIVGWYVSEAESAISTLLALSHALVGHDHVCAMVHVDNGSGYASRMMSEQSIGYYQQFSIEPMFALPYNAKAKGQVERWFGTMERDFGKRCETYCGADMAAEVLQRIVREVNAGKRALMTLRDYMAGLAAFIDRYHHTPHAGLGGRTPAELWATLERVPLEVPAAAIIRPRVERTVSRQSISLHNREYMAPDLVQWNGRRVVVEYDLHNDATVRVLETRSMRWLCDAQLVQKVGYLPASRIEEGRLRRLDGQRKRLQRHLDEAEARAGLTITHDQRLPDIERMNTALLETRLLPDKISGIDVTAPIPEGEPSIRLDTTTLKY